MKAKHTPGPWHWPRDSNELCPVNPDPRRMAVSSILTAAGGFGFLGRSSEDTMAEIDADRRLIAESPQLLVAAQQALYLLTSHGITHPSIEATIRPAIDKATGAAQ